MSSASELPSPVLHNTLSIDVEEYFHASNLESVAGPEQWAKLPSRVEKSTLQLLDIFDEHKTLGTFFVLGFVARRHPELVKEIARRGHEIASHGYGHRLVYLQTRKSFYRDILKTKRLLERITGKEVLGYRAPNFSITNTPWAYEALSSAGYVYDSSIYPTWHPRYANAGKPQTAFKIKTQSGEIVVFPLAVSKIQFAGLKIPLPVAGGAYWRIFPKSILLWGLSKITQQEHHQANCYLHPWEIDDAQPHFKDLGFLTKIRHYTGLKALPQTIHFFLSKFSFCPFNAHDFEELRKTLPSFTFRS